MKKMQCEVCGSTEIKKISDSTFECQSCGIQYSKEEVKKLLVEITGEVKIDHSAEVENTIKRAEQFAQEGNNKKAEEYLNKALDMDAENEKAIQRIKEINESKKLDPFYIIDANVDPEENVKSFLNQLATTENIVCDIYKEIEILSVKQQYRPSFYTTNKCLCEWSAIACHIYYENETVWKEKYNPSTKRYDKEPVTEKVKKVNRVPENGKFYFNSDGFGFASSAISNSIKDVDSISKNALLESFEELQADKYNAYRLKKLNSNSVLKKDGKTYYNNYEVDLEIEPSVYSAKIDAILKKGDEIGFAEAGNRVGGDYYENFSATRKVVAHSVEYILIPVQVIEYSYKGNTYVAVSDLVSQTTTITKLYPCDTIVANVSKELKTEKTVADKKPGFKFGIVLGCIGVIGMLLCSVMTEAADFLGPISFVLMIIGILLVIFGSVIHKKREKLYMEKSVEVKKTLINPRATALETSKEVFFKEYTDYTSAKNAAAKVACLAIENVHKELGRAGKIEQKEAYGSAPKDILGKAIFYIGEKHTVGPTIKILINGEVKGIIKNNEYVSVDIEEDSVVELKWNQAFSKTRVEAFAGNVKVFYLEYGSTNLIVKESGHTEALFDDLLRNDDMKTAVDCYCIAYDVDSKTATELLTKKKSMNA